eukprot:649196-Pyramimonas_sp.AAC.1
MPGPPGGGEHERLARDILQICSDSEGRWYRTQAHRLRHPHTTAANGTVKPPLTAPFRDAEASAPPETSSQSARIAKTVGTRSKQTAGDIPTTLLRTGPRKHPWRPPVGMLKPAPRLRQYHNLLG